VINIPSAGFLKPVRANEPVNSVKSYQLRGGTWSSWTFEWQTLFASFRRLINGV